MDTIQQFIDEGFITGYNLKDCTPLIRIDGLPGLVRDPLPTEDAIQLDVSFKCFGITGSFKISASNQTIVNKRAIRFLNVVIDNSFKIINE